MSESMARVDAGQLKGFIQRILSAAGLCEANARIVADSITTAELFGFNSHGVIRIPHYIKRLRIGSLNGNPDIRVVQQMGNTPAAPGFERVLVPGEKEYLTQLAYKKEGIPMPSETLKDLQTSAHELGLPFPFSVA